MKRNKALCAYSTRPSRSLLDFAKLMDRFNRAGVAFVSVTQNFSTADAMGRLTLNMLKFEDTPDTTDDENIEDDSRSARPNLTLVKDEDTP